jgi:hypothetical protein
MQETIHVEYEAPDGRRFSEDFELDLELFKGLRRIGRKDIDDVANTLAGVAKTIEKWTDTGGGLHVRATNRDRAQRREYRRYHWAQVHRVYKKDGFRAAADRVIETFQRRRGLYVSG